MAPVCVECRLAMRPLKNGVVVEEMSDSESYKLWLADSWKCPSCGSRVITGFAREPLSEHFMPTHQAKLDREPDRLRFWNSREEAERFDELV